MCACIGACNTGGANQRPRQPLLRHRSPCTCMMQFSCLTLALVYLTHTIYFTWHWRMAFMQFRTLMFMFFTKLVVSLNTKSPSGSASPVDGFQIRNSFFLTVDVVFGLSCYWFAFIAATIAIASTSVIQCPNAWGACIIWWLNSLLADALAGHRQKGRSIQISRLLIAVFELDCLRRQPCHFEVSTSRLNGWGAKTNWSSIRCFLVAYFGNHVLVLPGYKTSQRVLMARCNEGGWEHA